MPQPHFTRRRVLAGTAMAAGSLWAGTALWSARAADDADTPLRIPPLRDARAHGQSLALTAQPGQHEFFPGRASATLGYHSVGYNGSYLGPTLRVHRGDDVQITVTNALPMATSVHWHGLLVAGELDGGPHQALRPGASWRPVLPIRQPAATLWYHAHVHGNTGAQVYAGLAGLLIVTDEHEQALRLPSRYGVDDLPLVIQDRQFQDGRLALPEGMMTRMLGRRGDTLLVNGTVNPVARVPTGLVRLRLLNGANARVFELAFSDRRAFAWIASEGGLLAHPVRLRTLTLAPGERAEIVVDFSDARAVALETAADTSVPAMMRLRGDSSPATVLRFAPQPDPPPHPATALPTRLTPPDTDAPIATQATAATRRRRFVMNMGMSGPFTINQRAFAMQHVNETVRLGDTEIWEIDSDMMSHPFHIHGVHFRVLQRNRAAPPVRDLGLKDTVLVAPQEPVELLVTFTHPATAHAPFMYHCHTLEHEDLGMMGQFVVVQGQGHARAHP